jgi:NAD(P)-dependent dehydrogenase (short-subunit alcohol dehydrogenase family)
MSLPDLTLGLTDTHVLLTGSSGFIGSSTVLHLLAAGCKVTAVDIKDPPPSLTPNPPFSNLHFLTADITSEDAVAAAFASARSKFGTVQTCIALASIDYSFLPHHESLVDMSVDQWRRTMQVNVEGTFITARAWLRHVKEFAREETRNVGLVIVGSESGLYGERGNADYGAGKAAVQVGLVKSLMADVTRVHPQARCV